MATVYKELTAGREASRCYGIRMPGGVPEDLIGVPQSLEGLLWAVVGEISIDPGPWWEVGKTGILRRVNSYTNT